MKVLPQEPAISSRAIPFRLLAFHELIRRCGRTAEAKYPAKERADHLAVTDQRKCEPQDNSDREKQSANGSRNPRETRYRCAPTVSTRMHSLSSHSVHSIGSKFRMIHTNAAIKPSAKAAVPHFNISSSRSESAIR
jgi:hypothetical protein